MTDLDTCQRIWNSVAAIPAGKVASYSQVARHAGLPRRARLVGYALRHMPDRPDIPWHRVITAKGEIAFPRGSDAYRRQRRLLRAEGVVFQGVKIDLQRFGWRPQTDAGLDELLWKPPD